MARSKLKNKITFAIMVIILVLSVAYFVLQYFGIKFPWQNDGGRTPKPVTEGTLEVHMIDVGQGDCILVRAPEGDMLIDAGDKSDKAETAIKTYIDDLGIKAFDFVVFTHSDADHIGAADFVMSTYAVEKVIMPVDDVRDTTVYREMMTEINGSDAEIVDAVPGNTYSIGEMEFKILAPIGEDYEDVNNYSVVLRIDFGQSSFLMTGDAEAESEFEIVERYTAAELDCDVLKAGHHGSGTSSSASFLKLVTPDAAMISCGQNNKYGHPHSDVLKRLEGYMSTDRIYRTDLLGDIVLVSDGEVIKYGETVIIDESSEAVG